eukprot:GFUD01012238.1.p1 GENE.GFUD01012238.1~~GFUD01012238.1.p1  ORF type:complete len:503 (+),score=40.13 GFUD01012238.1:438-1946(+)
MSCCCTDSTSIVSLLVGLLWYIGGDPPLLRGSTVRRVTSLQRVKQTVNFSYLSKTLSFLFFVMLVTDTVEGAKLNHVDSSEHSWCGRSLVDQVEGADMVARASVVSRSRVDKGHYYATFRIDKLLYSTDTDLMAKFLRLKLETKSQRRKTSASLCNFSAKVKPNNKYLVMVKKQGEKKAGIFANADHYSLYSPPLKSTRKLMREVKSILCPDCREVHDLRQRVRVRRGRGGQQTSTNRSARDQIEGGQKDNKDDTTEEQEEDLESTEELTSQPSQQTLKKKKGGNKGNTRLSCSARGNPPPTLYWTMDGKVIKNSPSTRIITKNLSKFLRKSILKLKQSVSNRSVHLQCHAFNSYGHTSKVKMTKTAKDKSKTTEPSNKRKSSSRLNGFRKSSAGLKSGPMLGQHTNGLIGDLMRSEPYAGGLSAGHMRSPLYSTGCPIPDYCMNGGTCQFYSTIGEQTCHCARGYHGRRCERKYVSTGNFGPHMSDKFPMCLLGMAHYPCQ